MKGGCSSRGGVKGRYLYFYPCNYLCRTGGREEPDLVKGGCSSRDGQEDDSLLLPTLHLPVQDEWQKGA